MTVLRSRAALAAGLAIALSGCAAGGAGGFAAAPGAASPLISPRDGTPGPVSPDAAMRKLSDDYVAYALERDPTLAYFSGLEVARHDYFEDRRPAARAAQDAREDALRARLSAIAVGTLRGRNAINAHGQLAELLDAGIGARVCRLDQWFGVNHMGGWHLDLAEIADQQPVATASDRAQALTRWRSFPQFVEVEIANLRRGLDRGYSMPQPVVDRVLQQVAGLTASAPADSPYFVAATHSDDAAFKAEFATIVGDDVLPALRRYETFLRDEYRGRARTALSITALPEGAACYRALLRLQTTLDRSPEDVYALGQRTVAGNETLVREIGRKLFGTDDIPTIIERTSGAPDNHFASEADLLAFSRRANERAREKIAPYFADLPAQAATVEPFPEHERGTGRSSHYEPEDDVDQPGIFRINLDNWQTELKGAAEVTVAHENWPGHHLQIAYTRSRPETWPISKLAFNGAYIEGWGRYSERLAEEAGVYQTDYARITRRIWPARGMVVDPGLHLFGWTREQAVAYLVATGRFGKDAAEASVDRIAALPGQLTSYDSGGLEIAALRAEAEAALGARFDVEAFHAAVLDDGVLPLSVLRANVRRWIAAEIAAAP